MEILYTNCAGLDVHKKTVKACVLTHTSHGQPHKEFRTYLTTTEELLKLSDWLREQGCTHVAFEGTGVYWKPVFNGRSYPPPRTTRPTPCRAGSPR